MRPTKTRRSYAGPFARRRLAWLGSLRMWKVVGWLGALTAVACGLNRLQPYVRRINTSPTVIDWVNTPKWLGDENWQDILPELEARVALGPQTDLYDPRLCPYVAERLAGSPWVERVRRVAKQADGRVRVLASFRKPFAMVERNGTAYLVDKTGVRLPQQWASNDVNRVGWLVIRGAGAPAPRAGERWEGEDLAAGLKLARFLYRAEAAGNLPLRDSIRAIDVGNFGGRQQPRGGRLRLVTMNPQGYIHWGLPPGEEYGIEASAELKLARLCGLYAARGRLPSEPAIDLRYEEGIGIGEPAPPSD